jgi:two-component system nitrogen regulation response regulator GlnG
LSAYDWPGNVRELENLVKKAAILSRESVIERRDLFSNEYNSISIKEFLEDKLNGFIREMKKLEKPDLYGTVVSEVEKALFSIVLKETKGNQVAAAKILGINRNTLNKKLKEYKII